MRIAFKYHPRARCLSATMLVYLLLTPLCHAETTTVYLVRHAEKQKSVSRDPDLTTAGIQRAKALARMLRSVEIDACFVSQFKRTQQTAAPVAKMAELKVTQRTAGQESEVASVLKQDYAGRTILFVGHSDTVPTLMKHLGAKKVPQLRETDYDSLFLMQIRDDGSVTVTTLHYGEPNPTQSQRSK